MYILLYNLNIKEKWFRRIIKVKKKWFRMSSLKDKINVRGLVVRYQINKKRIWLKIWKIN